jgi:hypothetical protein
MAAIVRLRSSKPKCARFRRERKHLLELQPARQDAGQHDVVAYILSEAKIIQPGETMDAKTLPKVVMANKIGFEPDPRAELELYR